MRDIDRIEEMIKNALSQARPYLQKDGGDVEFISYESESGVAEVSLKGACRTCPLAIMTLRAGIERLIQEQVPEVRRIENVY